MSELIEEKRVLALKYRPHRFEDLVGQSTVSQTLSLALDSNRLSHAYLFSGLRGSGKTSTARIMAKALLCSEGPTSKPCEVCANCLSANTNRHLDIIEMDAASNRGIDDIKDLIEHTKYKPSSARFKVFIIDEVHMLTPQAFNALLKTLEEPPGFVKFILATTDPLKLPATILSRTQHFRFNKIAQVDVIHHLAHILNEENLEFENDSLELIARTGQGSLRDTLTLLDQAIIFSKGKITTSTVVDMLGLIDPKMMDNIFSVILNKGDILPIIKELEQYEVSQICDEISVYLKHKMIEKDSKFDLLLFDRFFRIISDAKQLLVINADGEFVLILTFMKMMEATNLQTIDEIINEVQKIETKEITTVADDTSTAIKYEPIKVQARVEEEVPKIVPEIIEEIPKEVVVEKVEEVIPVEPKQQDVPLDIIENVIERVNYQTPFDETPFDEVPALINTEITPLNTIEKEEEVKPLIQEVIKEEAKVEEISEPIVEVIEPLPVEVNANAEIEVVPFEEEVSVEVNEMYEKLTSLVYDRDYSLGECFEKNFIFNGYENNKLNIISYAQNEDRKFLYKHFGLIRTFAQDVYGNDVELDFTKGEVNTQEKNNKQEVQKEEKKNEETLEEHNQNDSASMIEAVEMGSGCVADMNKSANPSLAQQELELNDIINSKMLDKAKELFDIKKITVKGKN